MSQSFEHFSVADEDSFEEIPFDDEEDGKKELDSLIDEMIRDSENFLIQYKNEHPNINISAYPTDLPMPNWFADLGVYKKLMYTYKDSISELEQNLQKLDHQTKGSESLESLENQYQELCRQKSQSMQNAKNHRNPDKRKSDSF